MKTCPSCKLSKNDSEFYTRPNRNNKKQSYCKMCNYKNTLERQRRFKEICVKYKNGKCCLCGYNKCINALEFHHKDSSQKDFEISKFRLTSYEKNKEIIEKELDKCILVCANCHRELHYKER